MGREWAIKWFESAFEPCPNCGIHEWRDAFKQRAGTDLCRACRLQSVAQTARPTTPSLIQSAGDQTKARPTVVHDDVMVVVVEER